MGLLSLQDGSWPGRYLIPQASPAVGLFFQIVGQPVMSAVPVGTRSGFVVSCCGKPDFRRASGPTPSEQLLRGQSVSPRHRAHGRAGFLAFRHDPRFLLRQPFAPPIGAREHLQPALGIAGFKRRL
jgi:hypothetical protein